MEARVSILEVRVEGLEKRSDKHEEEDRRLHKYMTNMMEDLQGRLAGIERTGVRFEADLTHRATGERTLQEQLSGIFERIRVVERMIWVATGGALAVGGIATFFGWNILKVLGK